MEPIGISPGGRPAFVCIGKDGCGALVLDVDVLEHAEGHLGSKAVARVYRDGAWHLID